MPITKRDQILRMLKKTRVLRPMDVEAVGISRTYLNHTGPTAADLAKAG